MHMQTDLLTYSSVAQRIKAPTPKFFRKLRTIGLIIGGVGAALLASPTVLPEAVMCLSGYLVTAGAILAAVCQTTKESE
jgi:hypothetical protein